MLTIRDEQLAALAHDSRRRWLEEHLARFFPVEFARLAPPERDALLEEGPREAAAHRLTADGDVCLFVTVRLLAGPDFATRADCDWAREILDGGPWHRPSELADALYSTALRVYDRGS